MLPQQQLDSLERKMNERDRENLEFLLNADEETLKDWYDKMDTDDHEYASELLALYGEELAIKKTLIDDTEIKEFGEAAGILSRYRK